MVTTRESSPAYRKEDFSMLDLNDDCIEHILRRLNVVQQFHLSQLHPRFMAIVLRMWRTSLKQVLLLPSMFVGVNDSVFCDFMNSALPHVERLVVRNLEPRRLRLFTDSTFSRVETFDCVAPSKSDSDDSRDDERYVDDDVLMLQRVFPNLKVLKLRNCAITGRYLSGLRSLQQLCLDDCQYLESENFREIFQSLQLRKFDVMEDCDELNCCDLIEIKKCPTLEHIKIADYHLCFDTDIINDILRMPGLRKLSIYSKNFVFDVIERISKNHIKTIKAFKFNGVLHNFQRFFTEIGHMNKLRKLAFYECRGYDMEGFRNHMLQQVSLQLAELREVHFCGCDLESEQGLLYFVSNCRHLELINITHTEKIKESFVWRCIESLKKQKWRTRPLELWLRHTDIDGESLLEDPRLTHNSRLLRIDIRRSNIDSNPPGVLKFTFA